MTMLLPRFKLDQPSTLAEASALLVEYGDDGRAYAGGTELLLAMKKGGVRYGHLVDIKTIAGLDTLEEQGGQLRIGALVTHMALERSRTVQACVPALARMEARVANPRVRASGTIGGNLCFGEPHSDPATLLLTLEPRLHVIGPQGARETTMEAFLVGPYEVALEQGELLEAISVPCAAPGQRTAYRKFQINEYPMLGLALSLDMAEGGAQIREARVAVGSVSPTPRRGRAAEALLRGDLDAASRRVGDAANALADDAELLDDQEGSADYKRHLIGVLLREAFDEAAAAPAGKVS